MILCFDDFVKTLLEAGFSLGGGNADGIYSVVSWGWSDATPYETPVRWHTGDPETDPWEWRMRVLDERNDIAYSKLFFKKSGYISLEWYPYFLAVRRGGKSFNEDYASGTISHAAKRIYDAVAGHGAMPMHVLKPAAGFSKDEASVFDRALVELQMKMYLTMCGTQQKISRKGEEYGWSSTVFCACEDFFGPEPFEKASGISAKEAFDKIAARVIFLNPSADVKKVRKFITG